jgi:hypothetical protein
MRRIFRVVRTSVVVLVIALALVELLLRLASVLLVRDPALAVAPPDDRVVILCVGDSHTWGLGEGYPATLARLLEERSARYRVINLGVPGSNTALLRQWLPAHLDRFRPAVVVVWSGVNNEWNRRGTEVWDEVGIRPLSRLRQALELSRTWRFIRVWRHQSDLQRLLEGDAPLVAPRMYTKPGDDPMRVGRRDVLGQEEVHFGVRGADLPTEQVARVTELDLRWLAARCHERGIPMVAIVYPLPGAAFRGANLGIERASTAPFPLVNGAEALGRFRARYGGPGDGAPRAFDPSIHPTQALYDEIAVLVLEVLDRERLLPP